MNKLEQLLADLQALDAKIDALLAHDELTDAQRAEHDRLVEDRGKAVASIKREQDKQGRERERAELDADSRAVATARERAERTVAATPRRLTDRDAPTAATPTATRTRTDELGRVTGFYEPTDEQVTLQFGESRGQVRQSYGQIKKQNQRLLKSSGYTPWGEFKSLSEFIRAGLDGHQSSGFQERVHRHYASVQGMSEGVGSDGGYTVMPEFAMNIIDRVYTNDLWGRTDNYPVTGNSLTFLANAETSRATGSRAGGFRGYWLGGEGASLTASKPTLREVTLKLAKLGVVVYLTQELIDDGGFALQEYVARKAAQEFNFMIGDALVNGTGVGQPLGLLNCPSLVSVAKETGQTAATLVTENITKMFARFYAGNRSGLVWLHNQDIEPQLFTMTLGIGAAGVTTYMPPGGLSQSPYASLMGRPMLPTEFNATLGTQGDLIASDLSQMLSISKGGVAQAVSMHVQFLADQMAVRFIMRLNAGPWESAPITPYKGSSNTQSSFVTLDTRA